MGKRFLTLRETAIFINVSTHFLYKLTAKKSIPHIRIGRKILFDTEKLEKFINENSIEIVNDWSEKILQQ